MEFEFIWAVTSAGQLLLIWITYGKISKVEHMLEDLWSKKN